MSIDRAQTTVPKAREWSEGGQLYAILDACDMPVVLNKVKELGSRHAVSLYRGLAEENLESIAPYLVVVNAEVFDWITTVLWTEPWGVFVRSASSFEGLRTHFRKFLIVNSPEGREWYFRYYDPRVLGTYLPTCTPDELIEFFGPVTSFALTDVEGPGVDVLSFRR